MSEVRLYIAVYADADINGYMVRELQRRKVDIEYARQIGHDDWDDDAQLEYAVSAKRSFLTHNIKHFEPLYQKWWTENRLHYGIIVSPQFEIGEMVRRLLKLLDSVTAEEMVNNYKHLGEF